MFVLKIFDMNESITFIHLKGPCGCRERPRGRGEGGREGPDTHLPSDPYASPPLHSLTRDVSVCM